MLCFLQRQIMMIYDFDEYPVSDRNGSYGGKACYKEGILINDEYWIIKYPQNTSNSIDLKDLSYSSTPESEFLGSQIYELLGFPVHQTCLGIRNNHVVVACKDFCDDNHKLIEFRQLKNTYNKVLSEKLEKSFSSTDSNHFVVLEGVLLHLDYNPSLQNIKGLKERFWECVVIDGLINNNDRNNGNWGVLRGSEGDVLCPIFDNGASFSPNVSESRIIHKLNNPDSLLTGVYDAVTTYSLDGKKNATFKEFIKLDNPELHKAIKRNVPLIKNKENEIYDLIDQIPETKKSYKIISPERKEVYKKEINVRLYNILLPEYERLIVKDKHHDTGYER